MATHPPTLDYPMPPFELGMEIAARDLTDLVVELERSLTAPQRTLLHRIRLASESLGAARALNHRR